MATPTPAPIFEPEPEPTDEEVEASYEAYLSRYFDFRDTLTDFADELGDLPDEGAVTETIIALTNLGVAIEEEVAWAVDNPPAPCYAMSFDPYQRSLPLLSEAVSKMFTAVLLKGQVDGSALRTLERGLELYAESGDTPGSC